jgi:hypothetical protein
MKTRAIYASQGHYETEQFFDSLHSQVREESEGRVFDSVAAKSVSTGVVSNLGSAEVKLPESVQRVMERMPSDKEKARVLDAVMVGCEVYRKEHGVLPTADLIEAALQQGHVASYGIDQRGNVLDNVGSTGHHDQISAMPNRIVVAITSAIAEAFPAATYLPTDIGSNEAKLGIVSHLAGSSFGLYAANDIMDGTNVGKSYLSSERRITLTLDGDRDAATGQFLTRVTAGDGMQMLRGRTVILVNGYAVGGEAAANSNSGASTSAIVGSIEIDGTTHSITGTITVATGAVALAISPAFPEGTAVAAEGYIDYEVNTSLTPDIITQVSTYSLYAAPWRCTTRQTIDSKTQYQNELGLDLQSESLIAIRNQFAMERHYAALTKLKALALNNTTEFDFDYDTQIGEKTRAQIWQDFFAVLGVADQTMAENTMDHGITHLYVAKNVAAQMLSLPREIFEPSGMEARPGIYRLGRIYGRYEVYYTPRGLTETSTASEILCIGRSQQVARCPLVLGDAVGATYLPLAMGTDMRYGSAFYARNFTSVNPHLPSAKGAALINVVNLFAA